ncbi:MAG TPA: hypothetical protein VK674_06420 [Candidatus Limnocylindria bacterium]|nr:hypothetical protein [Candidatus Limnocylindria bacterium]
MAQAKKSPALVGTVEDTREKIQGQEQSTDVINTSAQQDTETRQEVAKKFVRYYFLILILIIIGIPLYNYFTYRMVGNADLLVPLKDTVLTYSAVVGPTMGLVVAYYFKSKSE